MTTEREALDLIRATATRSVPNCINLGAIDRILADVQPAQPAPLADAALAELETNAQSVAKYLQRNCEASKEYGEDTTTVYVKPAEVGIEILNALPALLARLRAAEAKAISLQAFKDFVHTTLDNAGIDKHEEQNATTGCRVGARLADLIGATVKGGQQDA